MHLFLKELFSHLDIKIKKRLKKIFLTVFILNNKNKKCHSDKTRQNKASHFRTSSLK